MTRVISPRGGLRLTRGGQLAERPGADLLVHLGQLPAHRGGARRGDRRQVVERRRQPAGGFEQHQRVRDLQPAGQSAAALAGSSGDESEERERLGRQPGGDERHEDGRGARDDPDRQSPPARLPHHEQARVGDPRRSGIGDHDDAFAPGDALDQRRRAAMLVVRVQRDDPDGDVVPVEQPARDPGVLAGDDIGTAEHVEGAQAHVPEMADRRRDDIEAGVQGGGSRLMAID